MLPRLALRQHQQQPTGAPLSDHKVEITLKFAVGNPGSVRLYKRASPGVSPADLQTVLDWVGHAFGEDEAFILEYGPKLVISRHLFNEAVKLLRCSQEYRRHFMDSRFTVERYSKTLVNTTNGAQTVNLVLAVAPVE